MKVFVRKKYYYCKSKSTQVDDEKYNTKANNATQLTIFKESPNS